MYYKIFSYLVFISIFLISSCDIFNADAETNKGITIKTSTASGVAARDVLQNEKGIFILGIAQKNNPTKYDYSDFYLAQIDQKGQLLWEKTYGGTVGRDGPNDMIATSDNHLLLVGYITKASGDTAYHRAMHIVKVDYSGTVVWEKNYLFKYDDGKIGNNSGNAVIEVSDGYIIGGGYVSKHGTRSAGATLTKISFEGEKIWSRSVTDNGGVISDLMNGRNPDHFDAVGYFPDADLLSFKNAHAGTAQVINFTDDPFSPDEITRNNNYLFISTNPVSPQNGASELSLYKLSHDDKQLLAQKTYPTPAPYNRRISFDISVSHNSGTIISVGYVEDHENNPAKNKAYVLKINPDLSPAWQFINHNASKPEEAIGTFTLSDGGVGVIVNARTPISNPCYRCSGDAVKNIISTSINSNVVLYRLDKDGNLQ